MRALLVCILVGLSFAAQAAEPFYFHRNGQLWSMPMPDEHWFSRPLLAPIIVTNLPVDFVQQGCTKITGKYEDSGCAELNPPHYCRIILRDDMPADLYAATLRHETAHCHGWPADHPTD